VRASSSASSSRTPISWVQEAAKQPVSQDTLAGIPWAGRSTLATLMHRVARDGPNDPGVWRKLVQRADVIVHSFTPKQAAWVLSALAKAQHRNESFTRRFCVKFVPPLIQTAELIDLCGIMSSLSQLDAYSEETYNLMATRAIQAMPRMTAKQLSLVANAFARVKHTDANLFESLLQHVPRQLSAFTSRDISVLLNSLTQLDSGEREGPLRSDLEQHLAVISLELPGKLHSADLQTLSLILNSLAQLRFMQKDVLDLLTEEITSNPERSRNMTARQLAMILNAAAKLHLLDPQLLGMLSAQIHIRAGRFDAQSLCVVANASAKLQLGLETFQILYTQVPRLISKMTGRQLAMLCHAWAKAHIHNDDLFTIISLPLKRCASELAGHEVAISVYGYAHFRKKPADLFEALLSRFSVLLGASSVSDSDLLMVVNALGRVGLRNEAVARALQDHLGDEPRSKAYLTSQAHAVFVPTHILEAQTHGDA